MQMQFREQGLVFHLPEWLPYHWKSFPSTSEELNQWSEIHAAEPSEATMPPAEPPASAVPDGHGGLVEVIEDDVDKTTEMERGTTEMERWR